VSVTLLGTVVDYKVLLRLITWYWVTIWVTVFLTLLNSNENTTLGVVIDTVVDVRKRITLLKCSLAPESWTQLTHS